MSRIHLDHAATSPLLPEVAEAMQPWLAPGRAANASSLHASGRRARAALDDARAEAAAALGVHEDEVLFTGSGTESDNLAIRGLLWARGGRPHLVVTAVEHEAVLRTARWLESRGEAELSVVPCEENGAVDPERLAAAIRPDTALVSVMAVNNETGVLQPVAAACGRGAVVHSDAVQAAGRVPVELDAELLSFSAHKCGGPAGVGLLVLRRGLKLQPALTGGGQEEGLRPGTESVAGAVGAARALRLAVERREETAERLGRLERRLLEGLRPLAGLRLHGEGADRAPGLLNLGLGGADGSAVQQALDLAGFATSTGSACSSGSTRPSAVLTAMGLPPERARSALRVSLGPENDEGDVDAFLESLARALDAARPEVRS